MTNSTLVRLTVCLSSILSLAGCSSQNAASTLCNAGDPGCNAGGGSNGAGGSTQGAASGGTSAKGGASAAGGVLPQAARLRMARQTSQAGRRRQPVARRLRAVLARRVACRTLRAARRLRAVLARRVACRTLRAARRQPAPPTQRAAQARRAAHTQRVARLRRAAQPVVPQSIRVARLWPNSATRPASPTIICNLCTARLLNNNWGSVAIQQSGKSCSAPESVEVNSDGSLGWTFNRGNCADDGSHPDYPELEYGVAPFGSASSLLTSPAFSSTTLLPIQVKNIQTAIATLDTFAINLTGVQFQLEHRVLAQSE